MTSKVIVSLIWFVGLWVEMEKENNGGFIETVKIDILYL